MTPHVLLVDDEPMMLSALKRALRRAPWTVETAPHAEAALARVAHAPQVAVVVSDHRMPGRSGLALLAELRRSAPGIGRILLSGYVDDIEAAALVAAAPQAVLAKPWDPAELQASIGRVLAMSEAT